MSKYPQLTTASLSEGVKFMTAYQRLERGWSFERAVSTPPRKSYPLSRQLRPSAPRVGVADLKRLFAWERPEWNARATAERAANVTRIIAPANDTAPLHIQRIRAAYCDEFMRGNINPELLAKLKDYADECRKASSPNNPADPTTGKRPRSSRPRGSAPHPAGEGPRLQEF